MMYELPQQQKVSKKNVWKSGTEKQTKETKIEENLLLRIFQEL